MGIHITGRKQIHKCELRGLSICMSYIETENGLFGVGNRHMCIHRIILCIIDVALLSHC